MRTLTATTVVALLGGLLLTVGCVPQSDYDTMKAANARGQDELTKTMAALENIRGDLDRFRRENELLRNQLKAKDEQIGNLNDLIAKLQRDLEDARARLAAALKNRTVTPINPLPTGLNKKLKILADKYGWIYDPKTGMVKLPSDFTFEKGKDDVNEKAREGLAELAKIMNDKDALEFSVYVAGHSDDIPIRKGSETARRHPTNWYLSVHRAVAVQEVLGDAGLAPERTGLAGFGPYHPVVANAPGNKGNSLNRRVEIWILPQDRLLTLPMKGSSTESTEGTETPKEGKESTEPAPSDATDNGATEGTSGGE